MNRYKEVLEEFVDDSDIVNLICNYVNEYILYDKFVLEQQQYNKRKMDVIIKIATRSSYIKFRSGKLFYSFSIPMKNNLWKLIEIKYWKDANKYEYAEQVPENIFEISSIDIEFLEEHYHALKFANFILLKCLKYSNFNALIRLIRYNVPSICSKA